MLTIILLFSAYTCFVIVLRQLVTVSTFSSFNLCRFTEEDGATINNEDRKEL